MVQWTRSEFQTLVAENGSETPEWDPRIDRETGGRPCSIYPHKTKTPSTFVPEQWHRRTALV